MHASPHKCKLMMTKVEASCQSEEPLFSCRRWSRKSSSDCLDRQLQTVVRRRQTTQIPSSAVVRPRSPVVRLHFPSSDSEEPVVSRRQTS